MFEVRMFVDSLLRAVLVLDVYDERRCYVNLYSTIGHKTGRKGEERFAATVSTHSDEG